MTTGNQSWVQGDEGPELPDGSSLFGTCRDIAPMPGTEAADLLHMVDVELAARSGEEWDDNSWEY